MSIATASPALNDAQFQKISRLVKDRCGINLHEGKKQLVQARLAKRLRELGLRGYREYIEYVANDVDGTELTAMLDAISTNLTSFFREEEHFTYLAHKVIPAALRRAGKSGRLRIWSAGCSTGEEPYSIAITVCSNVPDLSCLDAKILATDLSTKVLAHAEKATYPDQRVKAVPPQQRSRYFHCIQAKPERLCRVIDPARSLVHFARLNLMEHWPMRGPFDAIFCRNVMIYFDKPAQGVLVNRFYDMLAPGGTLFIGHSESLAGIDHPLRYVQPTVYEKPLTSGQAMR